MIQARFELCAQADQTLQHSNKITQELPRSFYACTRRASIHLQLAIGIRIHEAARDHWEVLQQCSRAASCKERNLTRNSRVHTIASGAVGTPEVVPSRRGNTIPGPRQRLLQDTRKRLGIYHDFLSNLHRKVGVEGHRRNLLKIYFHNFGRHPPASSPHKFRVLGEL